MPVNPAMQEAEVGSLLSKAGPVQKNVRPYLKNNESKNGLRLGTSGRMPA
jgi:hypothetical protein